MLKDSVITALRLGKSASEALSDEIERNINTARAELIRAGVSEGLANSENKLVENAIIAFCLMNMSSQKMREQYEQSWEYQMDCIRKSTIEVQQDV